MEYYSKAADCFDLSRMLRYKLGDKIRFYTSTYIEIPSGTYMSPYRSKNGENMLFGGSLPFYYTFSKNEFLRISVGSNSKRTELSEKMAALSEFYEAVRGEFGEPTVFYTTENDGEDLISLHWSFVGKEEEIAKFKSGTYFDDAEIDTLVVIGERECDFSDEVKEIISSSIGLPFDLIDLIDDDVENYRKYKTGKEVEVPVGAKIDGVSVTSRRRKVKKAKAKRRSHI